MVRDSFKGKATEQDAVNWASRFTKRIGSPTSIVAHSVFFLLCLLSPLFGLNFDRVLLFLTTLVSLEAIYLSLLIQLTVNQSHEEIRKVEEDLDEIQEDIDEIQEDVGEIQEDIDEIQEDVDEIQEDVGEIQEDVDGIEEGEEKDTKRDLATHEMIANIQTRLESLIGDIEKLKKPHKEITNSKNKKP